MSRKLWGLKEGGGSKERNFSGEDKEGVSVLPLGFSRSIFPPLILTLPLTKHCEYSCESEVALQDRLLSSSLQEPIAFLLFSQEPKLMVALVCAGCGRQPPHRHGRISLLLRRERGTRLHMFTERKSHSSLGCQTSASVPMAHFVRAGEVGSPLPRPVFPQRGRVPSIHLNKCYCGTRGWGWRMFAES